MSERIAQWIKRMQSEALPAVDSARPPPKMADYKKFGVDAMKRYKRQHSRWRYLSQKEREIKACGRWDKPCEEWLWGDYDKRKAAS